MATQNKAKGKRQEAKGNAVLTFSFFLLPLSLLLLLFCVQGQTASPNQFSQSFKVSGQPHLILDNPFGSVSVRPWNKNEIQVLADGLVELIKAEQAGDNTVKVETRKQRKLEIVNFTVNVPTSCSLNIRTISGRVVVRGVSGEIKTQTVDGDIELIYIKSKDVDATSNSGRVTYLGDLVAKGKYNFHSSNNAVDVTIPATASFRLTATSLRQNIDLGDFKFNGSSTGTRFTGDYAGGEAILNLSTHQGSIHLHKK